MPEDICIMGERFKAAARAQAQRPALAFAGLPPINYATLDAMSDKAAGYFTKAGVKKGGVIAIFAEKSPWVYAAMVGALKIGAPYVMLDTASPLQRLEKILDCCRPALLLVDRPFPDNRKTVPLTALESAAPGTPGDVHGDDAAYLMFTSGSTGTPKGVVISHASMVNFCDWAQGTFAITPQDVCSGANALYFDNSVFDFCASLFNGACLAPIPRDTVTNPKQLCAAVKECTIWFSVPSLLIYVMNLRALTRESWPQMRAIIFGGEGYPKAELKKLHTMYGKQAALWNVYGPTECTCICSAYAISDVDFSDMNKLAPLGHMALLFTAAAMDETGTRAVKDGDTGELFLMGPQVALGYYNDVERTAKSFAPNPIAPKEKCYRTGDLVWRDAATGYYHFAGRKDNQIKHMGYRIELEEIEAALNGMQDVGEAAVIYHRGNGPAGRIVAFATTEAGEGGLKSRLRELLPSYMIPEEIYPLKRLPKNANGKTDRKALAAEYGEKHG